MNTHLQCDVCGFISERAKFLGMQKSQLSSDRRISTLKCISVEMASWGFHIHCISLLPCWNCSSKRCVCGVGGCCFFQLSTPQIHLGFDSQAGSILPCASTELEVLPGQLCPGWNPIFFRLCIHTYACVISLAFSRLQWVGQWQGQQRRSQRREQMSNVEAKSSMKFDYSSASSTRFRGPLPILWGSKPCPTMSMQEKL